MTNKFKNYIIIFTLFISVSLIVLNELDSSKNKLQFDKDGNEIITNKNYLYTKNVSFIQPIFKHKKLDTTKFNYEGECREPFKYKNNNKRDLLFHAYYFKNEEDWIKQKERLITTFEINKSGIPNVTKVFFIYGNTIFSGLKETLESFGYQVIKSDVNLKKDDYLNVAVYRYFDFEKYLLEHQNEFDRVAITDVKDVYWFADGFSTIDSNELVMMNECYEKRRTNKMWCRQFGKGRLSSDNEKWVKQCFGDKVLNEMKSKKGRVINSGFVAGSTEKMLKFLKIYNGIMKDHIDKLNVWGLDQSALNVAYHFGYLDTIDIKLETVSQRMANDMKGRYHYDKENKIVYMLNSKCSPIIRHKMSYTT